MSFLKRIFGDRGAAKAPATRAGRRGSANVPAVTAESNRPFGTRLSDVAKLRKERGGTERVGRAFSNDQFWKGIVAALMLAEGHGKSLVLDPLSLVVREALEEILADYLNSGRWDDLPFSQWGVKPYLPGQMVFSLQMAERPQSGGLHDAYVTFTGGGSGAVIFVGIAKADGLGIDEAKERILKALDRNFSPQVEPI